MRIATDDESKVAMTDWAWRSNMRAGRRAEGDRLLSTIRDGLPVTTNRSYYEALLLYKGLRTDAQVLEYAAGDSVRFSSAGYGVAQWYLQRGDSTRGWELMGRIARSPHWNGFGVIAAEADLLRAGRRP
jgi:hypothetical protein